MFRKYLRRRPKRVNVVHKMEYSFHILIINTSVLIYLLVFLKPSIVSIVVALRSTKVEDYHQITMEIFGEKQIFYDYKTIFKLISSSFEKCKLCNYTHKYEHLSTSDDLAISVLYGKNVYNILNWVRSLRSTGCSCRILFFHEPTYLSNFNQEEFNAINQCGVTWCNLGVMISKYFKVHPTKTRFLVIQNFLEAYGNYFRSVMISDVFDTLFQKDPFIPELFQQKIVFSIERVQFGNHDWNMGWVKAIDPNWTNEFWRKKYVINNGFEIGKPDLMLRLLYTINKPEYFHKKGTSDQAAVNYVYYRGIFPDLWVDFKGEHYISACYSIFNLRPDYFGFMHEFSYDRSNLSVIHQFDRICPVAENFARICPALGDWHRNPSGRPDYYMQKCRSLTSLNDPQTIY